jgi:hypothetical protein
MVKEILNQTFSIKKEILHRIPLRTDQLKQQENKENSYPRLTHTYQLQVLQVVLSKNNHMNMNVCI